MNWNIFNAGWDKILHLGQVLTTGIANICTLSKKDCAEILFLNRENPLCSG